jgi:hypothetical protein
MLHCTYRSADGVSAELRAAILQLVRDPTSRLSYCPHDMLTNMLLRRYLRPLPPFYAPTPVLTIQPRYRMPFGLFKEDPVLCGVGMRRRKRLYVGVLPSTPGMPMPAVGGTVTPNGFHTTIVYLGGSGRILEFFSFKSLQPPTDLVMLGPTQGYALLCGGVVYLSCRFRKRLDKILLPPGIVAIRAAPIDKRSVRVELFDGSMLLAASMHTPPPASAPPPLVQQFTWSRVGKLRQEPLACPVELAAGHELMPYNGKLRGVHLELMPLGTRLRAVVQLPGLLAVMTCAQLTLYRCDGTLHQQFALSRDIVYYLGADPLGAGLWLATINPAGAINCLFLVGPTQAINC